MTNSMKNTLRSVVALSVIAVICVALLALANAFIPKYKPSLDLATVTAINGICPSGVDAQTAIDENYFGMGDINDKALASFNKENRAEANNAVLAVYKALKGTNKGVLIVEAQAQGYAGNDPIILLTAVDENGAIKGVALKSQNENSPGTNGIFVESNFKKFTDWAVGKTQISASDISAATNATSAYSIGGVANAVDIALKAASAVKSGTLGAKFEEVA